VLRAAGNARISSLNSMRVPIQGAPDPSLLQISLAPVSTPPPVEYARACKISQALNIWILLLDPPADYPSASCHGKHDLVKTPDGAFEFGWIQMNGDYVPGP